MRGNTTCVSQQQQQQQQQLVLASGTGTIPTGTGTDTSVTPSNQPTTGNGDPQAQENAIHLAMTACWELADTRQGTTWSSPASQQGVQYARV
ncbi:hypothetical protein IAQ61_003470 [Plenodomus lingam]|uniref:uncharacterized protein n=1 Tax=Leptosphaeria maculans TaxID=5022 RepID=UPI00332D01F6|nr:hypothetical protein IAQ61_003470 [Plenodomus lingam]